MEGPGNPDPREHPGGDYLEDGLPGFGHKW